MGGGIGEDKLDGYRWGWGWGECGGARPDHYLISATVIVFLILLKIKIITQIRPMCAIDLTPYSLSLVITNLDR